MVRILTNTTANLIESTPVDTGWARANWVPSLSKPVLRDVSAQSGEDRSQYVAGAAGEQADGQAKVLGYKLESGNAYITNNVPYIGDLNSGTSKQAPSGFVQTAISQGVRQSLGGGA